MTAQAQDFERAVEETLLKFPGEISRIHYSFGHDWSGDPAVFFRVVLRDAVSHADIKGNLTGRIDDYLTSQLHLSESELFPFFSYRSENEVKEMGDPDWE